MPIGMVFFSELMPNIAYLHWFRLTYLMPFGMG